MSGSEEVAALDSGSNPWLPLKDLAAIVDAAVLKHQPGLQPDLENVLLKHKSQFVNLLKNPIRSSGDAALVRKASTEGIKLPMGEDAATVTQKLSTQIVDEALIISDMFEINEISSLHLLLQAEEQLCQYPGLTRGLVAVLLYYDGRRCLVQSLRTLIQGRQGVTWTLGASPEVTEYITNYTDDLMEQGLVDKIITLLGDMDWTKESVSLQRNLALGDAKHRRLVFNLYEDIRQGLADCLFAYAAQSGFPRQNALRLLEHVSKIKQTESGPHGELDDVHVTLILAMLYVINASAANKEEDIEQLPIFSDPNFIPALHAHLGPAQNRRWLHPGIQAAILFGWSMSLATIRSSTVQLASSQNFLEDDEAVLDAALELGLFHCLPTILLTKKTLNQEEFYLRRVHQLITDLIVLMPLKVKELRNRADEGARNKMIHENEGIMYTVPLAGQHLEHLLNTVATIYAHNELGLSLMLEFWCPGDMSNDRFPARQVALNKFIRLMGDHLMPSLFKPYVEMLVSLSGHSQAALHSFNLLKANAGTSSVSWDHFFSSLHQYFANLKQESQIMSTSSSMDTIYRTPTVGRMMTRGISPAEVYGLVSVLRLITNVCAHSESARIAIAENPNWQPVLVLIGLLSCSVPTILKSEVLKAIAALAKSPEIGQVVWNSLEAAQLIVDDRTSILPTGQPRHFGLINELQDVECRNEEYPLCRGFLNLLYVLLSNSASVPANVNVHPYVAFVRDQIFLRFHARAYKRPEEKWEVGVAALKIVHALLANYAPTEADLNEKGGKRSPGFALLVDLMQMSELLRQLLYILDEGCSLLDKYVDFSGKDTLEEACLLVLGIIERGLELQPKMLDLVRAAGSKQLLNPLDRLLLGLNPRTGKPDHMLNVVKFVVFAWWLPRHGLRAVNILRHVSASANAQPLLLTNFTQTELMANVIIKGFTEMIESDFAEEMDEDPRIAVIQLLLQGLSFPAPTLSHLLLGFDLRDISRSTIQPPGVLGAVRSPMHAILTLLRPTDSKSPNAIMEDCPALAEAAYRLIYSLALNVHTSEPILRFLRSTEDFLNQQLSVLPLPLDMCNALTLRAVAWLLKTAAIELKMLAASRQRSHLSRMTMLILDGHSLSMSMGATRQCDDEMTGDLAMTQLSRVVHLNVASSTNASSSAASAQHIIRLLAQLNAIDFTDRPLAPPALNIFDTAQIGNVLKDLETTSELTGARAIDVKVLHSVLMGNVQGAVMGQQHMIEEEIEKILSFAVKWNSRQDYIMTQRNLLDAWRQVTEILLCCVPLDILPSATKQQLLLEVLQVLLNKVLSDNTLPELANPVSGVVILLLDALRQTYKMSSGSSPDQGGGGAGHPGGNVATDAFVSILDAAPASGSGVDTTSSGSGGDQTVRRSKMYSTALQVVLKGLISWTIETSSSAQRARANLYGALLNYLRIGNTSDSASPKDFDSRLRKANLDVLLSFGDVFIDVVCRDAVAGHDVRKMLALSLLDTLAAMDTGMHGSHSGSWLWYMSRQGYLRHIIDSLVVEDQQLVQLVASAKQEQVKSLYTFESKMALLTRLASSANGAELLLETGLMLRLAEMTVFSARPETVAGDVGPMARYQQILFPALRLCQALLSSLGSTNRSVTAQIIHFIGANECLVRDVLHYKDLFTPSGLQEMALLSGVLARCGWIDVNDANSYAPEVSAHLSRVQRQMLSLISHFGSTESSLKKSGSDDDRLSGQYLLETHANALLFTRNLITKGSGSRLIFAPSLAEATFKGDAMSYSSNQNVAFANRPPSLGHLVLVLRHLADHLLTAEDNLRETRDKLNSINVLSLAELSVHLPANVVDKLSSSDRRMMAAAKMKENIERFEQDIKLVGEAVEGGLFLLWKHLEHFLHVNISSHSLRDELSGPTNLSATTVKQLQKDAVICFDSAFFTKIGEIEKIFAPTRRDRFLEALTLRIKRLSNRI